MILAPGTPAPALDLPDQWGRAARLTDFVGVRPIVLVFVPFAFSRTCTGELGELRDHGAMFEEARAELLVASVDAKYSLRAWAEAEDYRFRMLSDFWPHGAVAARYGAFLADTGFATRATFAIDRGGVIRSSFASGPGQPRPLSAYRDALASL